MPAYLGMGSYSADALAAITKVPQNRREVVRQMVEKLGGMLSGFWMCFGEYDFVILADFPDDIAVAALGIAVGAAGAHKGIKILRLLSPEEAMTAMSMASSLGYKPPEQKSLDS